MTTPPDRANNPARRVNHQGDEVCPSCGYVFMGKRLTSDKVHGEFCSDRCKAVAENNINYAEKYKK